MLLREIQNTPSCDWIIPTSLYTNLNRVSKLMQYTNTYVWEVSSSLCIALFDRYHFIYKLKHNFVRKKHIILLYTFGSHFQSCENDSRIIQILRHLLSKSVKEIFIIFLFLFNLFLFTARTRYDKSHKYHSMPFNSTSTKILCKYVTWRYKVWQYYNIFYVQLIRFIEMG